MSDGQPALVQIAVAPNEALANIWRELLQAEGVPVLLRIGGPGLAYFAPALCEHHLHVRAAQAARARQLLDDYRATPDEMVALEELSDEPSADEEG